MTAAGKFARGLAAPLTGTIILANHRRLLTYAAAPFAITTLTFIVGLALGLPAITQATAATSHAFTNNPAAQMLLQILLWPALALALIFMLINIAQLVSGPLYSLLAQRTLVMQGALEKPKFAKLLKLSKRGLKKNGILLVAGTVLGLLSFIPILNLATSFIFLVLLAYDVVDYALDALDLNLERRTQFFRQHFAVFLGLGVALGLVSLVPGLNFFALPASVVGASDLTRRLAHE